MLLTVHLCRRSGSTVQAATALAAALVASSLAVAPVTAWAVISDLRNARELTAREAERSGPEGEGLDTAVVDRLAALIPRDATYALAFSPRVHPDHALVFRLWALSSLLPRVAVANPAAADWIVGWGVAPSDLGVRAGPVHVLASRRGGDPPVDVASARR